MAEHEVGRPEAALAAERALLALLRHYLAGPIAGGWIDKFDAQGRPSVEHIPASTFYHLFCAIAEADRVLAHR
jgi:mannose-6-phosphate isomerase